MPYFGATGTPVLDTIVLRSTLFFQHYQMSSGPNGHFLCATKHVEDSQRVTELDYYITLKDAFRLVEVKWPMFGSRILT